MKNSLIFIIRAFGACLCVFGLSSQSFGQGLTTAGITGTVTAPGGSPVSSAVVTALHLPTGTIDRTTTGPNGRYTLKNLDVGGPYTVTVTSDLYRKAAYTDINLELSKTRNLDFALQETAGEIVELEEFEVIGTNDPLFDSGKVGVGTTFSEEQLGSRPQIKRSFNDFAKFDPNVVLLADGDTNAGRLSVAGQNNRYNSIQVDGVKMNDQFGLGSDGLPSLTNPISLDALEEISVEIAPYDVRQSGFTGGTINAVTKRGTNEFHGSYYYIFTNQDLRGPDVNSGARPKLDEKTWGFTFGGPIVKNKLFFFANYEEFERELEPANPGFTPFQEDVDLIREISIDRYGYDPGPFGGGALIDSDEKLAVRADWNINENHRLSVRYNRAEGTSPSVGEFDDFSSSSPETALTSHFFDTLFYNDAWVLQLFSRWSDSIRTEFRFGVSRFQTDPESATVFPEFRIDDIRGYDRDGKELEPPFPGALPKGELYWGGEDSRQSNFLDQDVRNMAFTLDWTKGSHNITAGFDWEETEFYNLFLQETYGEIEFDGLQGFIDDEIDQFFRQTGIQGLPIAAQSDFTVTGLFIQDRWDISNRLTLEFGLRYDTVSVDTPPTKNPGVGGQSFEDLFGVPNDATLDGSDLIAPRFSFNYALDDDRTTQVRGGFGLFLGRNPGVWISNAFSNNGVSTRSINTFNSDIPDDLTTVEYFAGTNPNPVFQFSYDDPVVYLDPDAELTGAQRVDLLAPGLEMPSIWKFNLAVDRKLKWFGGSQFTVEFLQAWNNQGLQTVDINLEQDGTLADGRPYFSGRIHSDYDAVYMLTNTGSVGSSSNLIVSLNRPMKNGWFYNINYRWQDATDAGRQGSSTAASNFADTPRFDVTRVEEGTARDEIKNRVQVTVGVELELLKGAKSRFTLHYEGRSGRAYSYLFDEDINNDNASFDNDLVFVPSGPGDDRFDYYIEVDPEDDAANAAATAANEAAFLAFIESSGLGQYAGQVAPRNAFRTSWVHRFDFHFSQEIPLFKLPFTEDRSHAEFFVDILNVGNLINSSSGHEEDIAFGTLTLGSGGVTDDGKIKINFAGPPSSSDNVTTSRWGAQFGFRFEF